MRNCYLTCVIKKEYIQLGMFTLNKQSYAFEFLAQIDNIFIIEGRLFNAHRFAKVLHVYAIDTPILIGLEGNEVYEQIENAPCGTKRDLVKNDYILKTLQLDDQHHYCFGCPWSLSLQYYLWALSNKYRLLLCTTLNRGYLQLWLDNNELPQLNNLQDLAHYRAQHETDTIYASHYGLFLLRNTYE